MQYNKINSRIYYHEYATVGRAIKKIKTRRQKVILQDLTLGSFKLIQTLVGLTGFMVNIIFKV